MRKLAVLAFAGLSAMSLSAAAADVPATVTTGAGYIPVVKQIVQVCKAKHDAPAAESFGGNIGQMLAQIAAGSDVNIVITDKATIDNIKTPVKFSVAEPLGSTYLTLIWKKGLNLTKPEDLKTDLVKSIALPDPQAAVYGRAGSQWIAFQNDKALADKKMVVAGVPQVASYVARGEFDAGFVNVQAAKKGLKNLGGMMVIKSGYKPIVLHAFVVEGQEKNPAVQKFLTCLKSKEVSAVLEQSGVEPAAK